MKKFIILIFPLISFWNASFSQSTTICPACNTAPGPNQGVGGEFLGWNNLNALTLDVRNDNFYPIYWWTNNVSRMQIYEDEVAGLAANSGFVGIGDIAGLNVSAPGPGPQSLLHLHLGTDAADVFAQFTNTGTGASNLGFQIGLENTHANFGYR